VSDLWIRIRPAELSDLPRLTEIYKDYLRTSPITFDIDEVRTENRGGWFEDHSDRARHRLLVAEDSERVIGYAGTGSYRSKGAYDTTVETTIYVAPVAVGGRIGTRLYRALFDAIANEGIRRIVAGITLPNDASVKLHERFGFTRVGVFAENGRKFGRYWDVLWMERKRSNPDRKPD
jgi:phosphinothricin acetyltransferase